MNALENSTKEIKGNLARLLATENLVVEHKKVSTASFNVQTRVLVLPLWEKASTTVYDLLVGHEVGHALYTPNEDWPYGIPRDFINVVEDVRIEKLMKRKYPGLAKDFYNGYQELNDMDFFDIKDDDLNRYSLIDRINLYFKVGSYSMIPFKEREMYLVDIVDKAETFDDVIEACKKILDYIDQEKNETDLDLEGESDQVSNSNNSGNNAEDNQQNNSTTSTSSESQDGEDGKSDTDSIVESNVNDSEMDSSNKGGESFEETVSKTQRSFDQSTENLNSNNSDFRDYVYLERSDLDIDNIVVDFQKINQYISKHFTDVGLERQKHWGEIYENVDAEYQAYKKQSQKEVNYLVKEFECRKSADAYARAGSSKTGILDTKQLHTYKYNDDLFKKITILPDGKNHGMIFILDWSGSMCKVLLDTYKQLLNLIWFCKKVQIPFEVYAFTYDFMPNLIFDDYDREQISYQRGHCKIGVNEKFKLLNFISSRSSVKDFEKSLINVWRMCCYYTNSSCHYHLPVGLDLSGTPLNETIMSLHKIIPNFKNTSKSQKISVCILTDGEANGIHYDVNLSETRGFAYVDGKPYIGKNTVGENCILRDKKIGRVYRKFTWNASSSITTILLENLKDNFPEVNIIGFRLARGSDFSYFYREIFNSYVSVDPETLKQWKKNKSWEFRNIGYDSLYYISSASLSEDAEFQVPENASKNEISRAFRSMLKSKTTNKKILNSFISVVS